MFEKVDPTLIANKSMIERNGRRTRDVLDRQKISKEFRKEHNCSIEGGGDIRRKQQIPEYRGGGGRL